MKFFRRMVDQTVADHCHSTVEQQVPMNLWKGIFSVTHDIGTVEQYLWIVNRTIDC